MDESNKIFYHTLSSYFGYTAVVIRSCAEATPWAVAVITTVPTDPSTVGLTTTTHRPRHVRRCEDKYEEGSMGDPLPTATISAELPDKVKATSTSGPRTSLPWASITSTVT